MAAKGDAALSISQAADPQYQVEVHAFALTLDAVWLPDPRPVYLPNLQRPQLQLTLSCQCASRSPYRLMGDVTCTYASSPREACGSGCSMVVTDRVSLLRIKMALHMPSGTPARSAADGGTAAACARYGSGSCALLPAYASTGGLDLP